MNMNSAGNRKLLGDVELMRFVGAILIMGCHLFIIGYEDGKHLFSICWVWVDFFFILTGALTCRHYLNKSVVMGDCGEEALAYTIRKFKKLVPYVFLALVMMYVVISTDYLRDGNIKGLFGTMLNLPFEMLFVSSSGIITPRLATIWYLSALFIVLPIFVYMNTAHNGFWKIFSLLYSILYFGKMGVNAVREWPNDLLRAFACLCLGNVAVILATYISKQYNSRLWNMIFSFMEVVFCVVAVYRTVFNKEHLNLIELLFFAIVAIMMSEQTAFANIDNKVVAFLGKLSIPMYLFHMVIANIVIRVISNLRGRTLVFYVGTLIISVISVVVSDKYNRVRK